MSDFGYLEVDLDKIKREMKEDYEARSGETLYEASSEALLIDYMAYWIWHTAASCNEFGRQTLRQYASGKNLDAVIENQEGIKRIEHKAAEMTLRFYVKDYTSEVIPKGTKVTKDGTLWFETCETCEAVYDPNPGGLMYILNYADVKAKCLTDGPIGNGVIGEMKFEGLLNVTKCEVVVKSHGGRDRETDEEYYLRSIEEGKRYSTAGPIDAYEYFARKAADEYLAAFDTKVKDVRCYEKDDWIKVYITAEGVFETDRDGYAVNEEGIRIEVGAASAADRFFEEGDVKPQGDRVDCLTCEAVKYRINIGFRTETGTLSGVSSIAEKIKEAVEVFKKETDRVIDGVRSEMKLLKLLADTGASSIEIREPKGYLRAGEGKIWAAEPKVEVEYLGDEEV